MTGLRKERVKQIFDRSSLLELTEVFFRNYLLELFDFLLEYDCWQQDSSLFPVDIYNQNVDAVIVAKDDGIVSCVEEIKFLLEAKGVEAKPLKEDGDRFYRGDILFELRGSARRILSVERVILNIFQRVCAISTATRSLVDEVSSTNCQVAATRKTLLGLIEKKAVSLGGGLTHRLNLEESAMIKDNHLKLVGSCLDVAIKEIIKNRPSLNFVEIEVRNVGEFKRVVELVGRGIFSIPIVVMFDHFSPDDIAFLVDDLRETSEVYDSIFLEASGNISKKNIIEYAQSGVDVVSSGYITHSVRAKDFTLLID